MNFHAVFVQGDNGTLRLAVGATITSNATYSYLENTAFAKVASCGHSFTDHDLARKEVGKLNEWLTNYEAALSIGKVKEFLS